jgi:transposase-like protein
LKCPYCGTGEGIEKISGYEGLYGCDDCKQYLTENNGELFPIPNDEEEDE